MSSIIDMVSAVNRLGGLAASNRFVVQITPPSLIFNDARNLTFLCETVNLPGIQFGTEDVKHKGYGTIEKRATSAGFEDVTCTFFIDNSGICLSFFHRWAQLVYSFDYNHDRKKVDGMSLESFNYPEDFWGTIEIQFKTNDNRDITVYTLDKAWPSAIGSMTLGWEQNDSLARLPITFNYRSFSTDKTIDTKTTNNEQIDTNSTFRDLSVTEAVDALRNTINQSNPITTNT